MSDSVDPRTAHVQTLFIPHPSPLRGFLIAKKAASFEPGSDFIGWACTIARDDSRPIRKLHDRMDEILVCNRGLSAAEITPIFRVGQRQP